MLHFIALYRYVIYQLKFCGYLILSKSVGTIFPPVFAHFVFRTYLTKVSLTSPKAEGLLCQQ